MERLKKLDELQREHDQAQVEFLSAALDKKMLEEQLDAKRHQELDAYRWYKATKAALEKARMK